jgi:phosphonate transport system substrate-binding protein
MIRRVCGFGATVSIIWILVLFHAWYAPSARAADGYTFGVVPQFDKRQLFAIWKPILDELGRRTGLSLTLVTQPTIPAFDKECLNGTYDFAYLNPYYLPKVNKSAGYLPVIRDSAELRGVLVVRRDSPIRSPAELNGKTVAFPAPNALGASLLMRADLANLFHAKINPLYVKSHASVYLHVAKGLVDAGGGVNKTLQEQAEPVRETLKVIYVTRPIPSHPVISHPRVPPPVVEKVRRAFIEMAATPGGLELLAKVPMNQPVAASLREYTPMMKWGLENFWVEE